jgi:uncharacterized protein (TIGR02246 family)
MRKLELFGCALMVLAAVAQGRGQTPATGQPKGGAASDAIKAIADGYVKGVLAGDAKGVAALYAEDAVEMPPNQPMVKGRDGILQYYEKTLGTGMKPTTFSIKHLETAAAGDHGYDVGVYQQTVTVPGNATTVSDSGKYTVILKRAGNDWKIAYVIYNSDQPPPGQR